MMTILVVPITVLYLDYDKFDYLSNYRRSTIIYLSRISLHIPLVYYSLSIMGIDVIFLGLSSVVSTIDICGLTLILS